MFNAMSKVIMEFSSIQKIYESDMDTRLKFMLLKKHKTDFIDPTLRLLGVSLSIKHPYNVDDDDLWLKLYYQELEWVVKQFEGVLNASE